MSPEAGLDAPPRGPLTFSRLKWTSFFHSLLYSALLLCAFAAGKPEPLTADEITPVSFHMQDICHTFKKGHRLMVQVQSSWFPLVDRNPQKFCDIYQAREEDFQKATQRVYHSPQAPSRVELQVLTR